jgi:Fic family protein
MKVLPKQIAQIAALRRRFFAAKVGNEQLLPILDQAEVSEHVYNSNAIENSTLSLEETEKILQQIELDRFITEREIFEAKNLARVVEYISHKATDRALDRETILLLHKMLIANIRDDVAGRFRSLSEWVRVGSHIGSAPADINEKIATALAQFHADPTESVLLRLARFHLEFESIHPFVDGNGRIGRVLVNYLLIREGYVPINIAFVDRSKYYDAFNEYHTRQGTKMMEQLIFRALTNSYHKRLAYMEGQAIMTLNAYAKKHKLSHANVINKAKRQTIEAFIEHGVWKIGDR